MAHPRTFRFGIQLNTARTGAEWTAMARKAEELGYSTLFLPDHFGDQLAPVPGLAAAAAVTSELRIGALVFDNDYRHPVVLAKEAATLDLLSDGRLELGIGAGWMNTDYEQSGIPQERAGVRISKMEEGIAVMKGLFADGPFSFTGEHYTITAMEGLPKPVQKSGPPLLIGGGAKRVLGIAGREADIVGINPSIRSGRVDAEAARNGSAAETDQKVEWVRDGAGDRFGDLELNMLVFAVVITDDRSGTVAMMAPMFGLEPDEVSDYPHAWFGSVDQICDDLIARRERWGVSYLVVQADAMETAAPIVARLAGT